MKTRTVNLVATPDAIERYHPGTMPPIQPGVNRGIISAEFPVNPARCKTALGRWLVEHIKTTRFDDSSSIVNIAIPITTEGQHIKDLAKQLAQQQRIESRDEAEFVYAGLERWIANRRREIFEYDTHQFSYRVIAFNWPVFGSRAAGGVDTPEAFFDRCGQMMRNTGGVILRAGLDKTELPESLARTMAKEAGGGDKLLERHRMQSEK